MTNPNDPAFLSRPEIWYESADLQKDLRFGLTKREYFAAMAMQGISSNSAVLQALASEGEAISKILSRSSVELADALIAELSK